jgi:hypothetical protein
MKQGEVRSKARFLVSNRRQNIAQAINLQLNTKEMFVVLVIVGQICAPPGWLHCGRNRSQLWCTRAWSSHSYLRLAESNGHLSIDTSDDYVSELDVSRLIMLPFGTTEHPHSEPLRSY